MEKTAYDAFITGINILIFVLALTITINLMVSVRKMSDTANDIMKNDFGSMVETEDDTDRILTGQELLYYAKDLDLNGKYKFYYNNTSTSLETYINTNHINTILNYKYSLSYVDEKEYLIKSI